MCESKVFNVKHPKSSTKVHVLPDMGTLYAHNHERCGFSISKATRTLGWTFVMVPWLFHSSVGLSDLTYMYLQAWCLHLLYYVVPTVSIPSTTRPLPNCWWLVNIMPWDCDVRKDRCYLHGLQDPWLRLLGLISELELNATSLDARFHLYNFTHLGHSNSSRNVAQLYFGFSRLFLTVLTLCSG